MTWEAIKEHFIEFIINNNVIGFPEQSIKLKSGRSSCFYVNWRTIAEDVYLLDKLTDYLLSFTKHLGFEPNCFYGVPEGASKLGIITQFKWAKSHNSYKIGAFPLAMGRGKPKNHGESKDKFFLGYPKGDVIILEDVSTTGQSLIKSVNLLKNFNINILTVIALTNREEISDDGSYFEDILKEMGIKYNSMSNIPEILSYMDLNPKITRQIKAYYKEYGIREIKL